MLTVQCTGEGAVVQCCLRLLHIHTVVFVAQVHCGGKTFARALATRLERTTPPLALVRPLSGLPLSYADLWLS